MKDWYLRQTPRDRMIVVVLGLLTFAGGLYALAWHPLQSRLQSTQQAIASKQATLDYIRRSAVQLQASGGKAPTVTVPDKAPYRLIFDVIQQASLKQPERLEPSGANGARVQFAEVEFDKLVQVLAELERYGLQVTTLNISRKDADGFVSARFNMERG